MSFRKLKSFLALNNDGKAPGIYLGVFLFKPKLLARSINYFLIGINGGDFCGKRPPVTEIISADSSMEKVPVTVFLILS